MNQLTCSRCAQTATEPHFLQHTPAALPHCKVLHSDRTSELVTHAQKCIAANYHSTHLEQSASIPQYQLQAQEDSMQPIHACPPATPYPCRRCTTCQCKGNMNDASTRLSQKIVTHVHLAHSDCDYGCGISKQLLLTCHTNTTARQVREMSTTHDQKVALQHHRTTCS